MKNLSILFLLMIALAACSGDDKPHLTAAPLPANDDGSGGSGGAKILNSEQNKAKPIAPPAKPVKPAKLAPPKQLGPTPEQIAADLARKQAALARAAQQGPGPVTPPAQEGDNRPAAVDGDGNIIKSLGQAVPIVICTGKTLKESEMYFVAGWSKGEMILTCSKGIAGTDYTSFKKTSSIAVGVGLKQIQEDGEIHYYMLGISQNPQNPTIGLSCGAKADYAFGGTSSTPGTGYAAGIGLTASVPGAVGIYHFVAKTKGFGASLSLECEGWVPACSPDDLTMLQAKGVDVNKMMSEEARRRENAGLKPITCK